MANRVDAILEALSAPGLNFDYRGQKFAFDDFENFDFVFFAEFEGSANGFLRGPVNLFRERVSLFLRSDVEVIGAKLGCIVVFFGANGITSERWNKVVTHGEFHRLLSTCRVRLLFADGAYLRRTVASKGVAYVHQPLTQGSS